MRSTSSPTLPLAALGLALTLPWVPTPSSAQNVYYICPGNVFTNTLTAKEAESKGCKSREAATPATVPAPARARPSASSEPTRSPNTPDVRVQRAEQEARDTDARRILEAELRKEEAALEALRKEYNNGEPERRGDERNGQKYLERTESLKAALTRKEADVAAIRREIAKLGGT
ncbi:hypothetical protein [Ideonella livida]|uniref:DUF4124 domain-containing protein n=1 Tax=Ideonella livida TaxID=2707176 RepID=A0A7C9PG48_9BURK|nr:hypothetical protein [Ideonella livida]NDY90570.1 hypothetical protein [Ideonella livida]